MNQHNDEAKLQKLKKQIEETTGRKMSTPKDFELLTLHIYDRTNTLISATTLKRFWGYIDKGEKKHEIRQSTLNVLAQYVGRCDWDSFCKQDVEIDDTSNLLYGRKTLFSADLHSGDRLQIFWRPNRLVTLRYSGNNVFLVIDSQHSKLSIGDTFKCNAFVQDMPLILTDLIHESQAPCSYVCGKQGGISFNQLRQ